MKYVKNQNILYILTKLENYFDCNVPILCARSHGLVVKAEVPQPRVVSSRPGRHPKY